MDNALRTFQRLELALGKGSLLMDGHVLSKEDTKRVSNAYIMQCMLLVDIGRAIDSVKSIDPAKRGFSRCLSSRNVVNIHLRGLAATPVDVVMTQQKNLLQLIRHLPITAVKKYKLHKMCDLYGYDRTLPCNLLLNRLLNVVSNSSDTVVFKYLNDAVQFMCRLTLRDVNWVEEENIQAYKDFESSLIQLRAEYGDEACANYAERQQLLDVMHDIVTDWFSDFKVRNVESQHGYGATAQVKRSMGTAAKYHAMDYCLETTVASRYLDWFPQDGVWRKLPKAMQDCLDNVERFYSEPKRERITRVQLVPKGINKKRVVSMDDTTNQFLQKTMQDQFARHFQRHPEMKIKLHDQEHNRFLALQGSLYRQYGTADLSSASDSVSWTIVKRLFWELPGIYSFLCNTRTRVCELPDGTRITMEKAYPMGSALCFPIECVVFSAVIAATNRQLGVHTNYSVYGDDLIIHSTIWERAIHNLELLGFIVNHDKSFPAEAPFKESCGIECWHGVDVSPLRLSRKWDVVSMRRSRSKKTGISSATGLGALYDLGNQCFDWGYSLVRKYIIELTRHCYGEPLFANNHEYGFISNSTDLNCGRKTTVNPDNSGSVGGIAYYRATCIKSRTSPGPEYLRYSKLLDSYSSTRRDSLLFPEDRIESACGAAETYVSKSLVPVWLTELSDQELSKLRISSTPDYLTCLVNRR